MKHQTIKSTGIKSGKALIEFAKQRDIYAPHSIRYKKKFNPSTVKEEKRQERRYRNINRYDDEVTREGPIEALNTTKATAMYKMLNDVMNNHRLTRKKMPLEVKKEYIAKGKEFALFKSNEWRRKKKEQLKCISREVDMIQSAWLLPPYLTDEIFDIDNTLDHNAKDMLEDPLDPEVQKVGKFATEEEETREDIKLEKKRNKGLGYIQGYEMEFKENSETAEMNEFTPEFLYFQQALRVFPDDYNIIYRLLMNLSAYQDMKAGGAEGEDFSMNAMEEAD